MPVTVGVARHPLTPPWGVELAGFGYYLGRTWQRIRDDLTATALVVDDGRNRAALVAVDLMYIDAEFSRVVRQLAAAETDLEPESITIAASHSHNAPTTAFVRGVGEVDSAYVAWAQRQVATAIILAWRRREEATIRVGHGSLDGWTFNRTREGGAVDSRVSVLCVDDRHGRPLALVTNFAAHPTVQSELGISDVSRDYPGQLNDILETVFPGTTAMFLQGSCGDVNFLRRYREDPETSGEPGRALAGVTLEAIAGAQRIDDESVGFCSSYVSLPTRRYRREDVLAELEEGRYRLESGDTSGWRETLGRGMVNQPDKFPSRYGGDESLAVQALSRFAVEWTEDILRDLETRPEVLQTQVHAIRIGDVFFGSQPAELFSSLALDLRNRWPHDNLFVVGYANDAISYLADPYDIERKSYAAAQSPKFMGNFPFIPESGPALIDGMLNSLAQT
ncbi:MAG: hypothetical protein CMJ50_04950 [Planctomycetaceae bacterium]|nr:hypothetical protein [Planctomycetaceae bacterium]